MKASEAILKIAEAHEKHSDDPEVLHSTLDDILLECVPKVVAITYMRVRDDAKWWASS